MYALHPEGIQRVDARSGEQLALLAPFTAEHGRPSALAVRPDGKANPNQLVIDESPTAEVETEFSDRDILAWQSKVQEIFVEKRVIQYATELVQATRHPEKAGLKLGRFVRYGASPRGSIALIQGGRAHAFLEGRKEVRPEDVKAVAHGALRHRILTTYYADAEGVTSDQIVDQILETVKVP